MNDFYLLLISIIKSEITLRVTEMAIVEIENSVHANEPSP